MTAHSNLLNLIAEARTDASLIQSIENAIRTEVRERLNKMVRHRAGYQRELTALKSLELRLNLSTLNRNVRFSQKSRVRSRYESRGSGLDKMRPLHFANGSGSG